MRGEGGWEEWEGGGRRRKEEEGRGRGDPLTCWHTNYQPPGGLHLSQLLKGVLGGRKEERRKKSEEIGRERKREEERGRERKREL
jgi:hypothetical protein